MRTTIPRDAVLIPEEAACVFKGLMYDVYQWQQELFDGSFETFEMLKRCDSVRVLAIEDNRILIQKEKQPRMPIFFDFPGGRHHDPTETELAAAQRELLEETGLVYTAWTLVDVWQVSPKIDSFLYTFVAHTPGAHQNATPDAGEKIEHIWTTLPELRSLIEKENFRSPVKALFDNLSEINDFLNLPEYTP